MADNNLTMTVITHVVIEGRGYDTIALRGRASSELDGIAMQMVAITNGLTDKP